MDGFVSVVTIVSPACFFMCGVRCFHIAAEIRKSSGGYETVSEKS